MSWTQTVETNRLTLRDRFRTTRAASVAMCEPLAAEDYRIQPIAEVSPPWWNLGHTSWFFARNVLAGFGGQRTPEDDQLEYLLNSYYASFGPRIERFRRGLVTRPTTDEIYAYRRSVDRRMEHLLETAADEHWADLAFVTEVGIQHEQQHQELFYSEIKCILAQNPVDLRPAYREATTSAQVSHGPANCQFVEVQGGLVEFGNLQGGWCWDNELPVHRAYLPDFAIENRLITCGDFLEFIDDGGYQRQLLWLDNGWAAVQQAAAHQEAQHKAWNAPLYWEHRDEQWWLWTLGGMRPVDPTEPVCHVSFYEADAFARWRSETFDDYRGVRLPTEQEWEHAARYCSEQTVEKGLAAANFLDTGRLHPEPASRSRGGVQQMLGDVWEWTSSYYAPYPGYQPFPGALAEYNGKFMDNQRVLRGGSCVSERDHLRLSYRNFWAAATRFQFTGFRLARDA